ncbi:hypothetical protein LCGC14_2445020 [marine sediment metagenome]|uniref:Uncharacterized protein n=1 Tax=marine sediment metagenome TaxID=412755 RepID=A0A0F9C5A8_9ZZZZ
MKNTCPHCDTEVNSILIVKVELIVKGDTWEHDPQAIADASCPECGNGLDIGDLATIGVPSELLAKVGIEGAG